MFALSEFAIFLQSALTALAAACNAVYFLGYRAGSRRRRIGAGALAAISAAAVLEGLYVSLYILFRRQQWPWAFIVDPRYWLLARGLGSLGVFLISGLILYRWLDSTRR